jgi:hypothetical protein
MKVDHNRDVDASIGDEFTHCPRVAFHTEGDSFDTIRRGRLRLGWADDPTRDC